MEAWFIFVGNFMVEKLFWSRNYRTTDILYNKHEMIFETWVQTRASVTRSATTMWLFMLLIMSASTPKLFDISEISASAWGCEREGVKSGKTFFALFESGVEVNENFWNDEI